jgi:hypothetical protein
MSYSIGPSDLLRSKSSAERLRSSSMVGGERSERCVAAYMMI